MQYNTTPYFRRLDTEDRWRLESQAAELVQNSERYGLVPILDSLLEIHARLFDRRRVTAAQCSIIEWLYSMHCGKWGA
jgi:hypothetical protein